MPNSGFRAVLLGRRTECEILDDLVSAVRDGRSQVLVLHGEAGIGKTALLKYLAGKATDCQVVRVVGAESEMDLAYSGLHQLCAPHLDRLARLPEPQHRALSTALGMGIGAAPDRFLVGLAALSLLAESAAQRPLICVVDDAQWLDRFSALAIAFIARRLLAERIAIVFAMREFSATADVLSGLPVLAVSGIHDEDARALLDSATPGRLDEHVRDRIVFEARGNPLALLELSRGVSAAELAGGFGRPDVRPMASQIEDIFLQRLRTLPASTRQLILIAAADPTGDVSLLWRAAAHLGLTADAAGPAQVANLVELGTWVRFRHPLVRSAAYRAASMADRQAVHGALAVATDPTSDPDRRAWHRAHAASVPDESVAAELERSAGRAQARAGVAAGAAFLLRATELTPDPAKRTVRALAAAEAKIQAAAPDEAYRLLAMAELGSLDDLQRARLARLRAQIVFMRNHGGDAIPMLHAAARQFEDMHHSLARETYLEALGAAVFAGRLCSPQIVAQVAGAARDAAPGPDPPRPIDLLLDGVSTRFSEGYAAALPAVRLALQAFRRDALLSESDIVRWLWLAWLLAADIWDYDACHELSTRAVRVARESGALTVLPVALVYQAGVHVFAGELDVASRLTAEADALTSATGYAPIKSTGMVLAAIRGTEDCAQVVEEIESDAMDRGEGRVLGSAAYATALLNNGLGRYDLALTSARQACRHDDPGFYGWALAELVEAGARAGAPELARDAMAQLEERTLAAGTDWALGFRARCRALLADGPAAEELYREAIERLERTPIRLHAGRAHLLYGEWLLREQRPGEARRHLRIAEQSLRDVGAHAFAERARYELAATGETVRTRARSDPAPLSTREAQIAQLAADGLTNPEIGARLFLSPHTVEWHLRKVYAKLGIRSRRHLSAKLAEPAVTR
ncbi:helix-turn-helix transcriptional regulator [Mycolicibacterium cosmeticum]|uniref:helix-turn-helix transcriptional regulator n=1 Tax=Mycolicibacterium cosmeticum TaxID=258533 RepID=UPI003204BD6C